MDKNNKIIYIVSVDSQNALDNLTTAQEQKVVDIVFNYLSLTEELITGSGSLSKHKRQSLITLLSSALANVLINTDRAKAGSDTKQPIDDLVHH